MIVENWKAELEKSLPDVEKFLTSVLQEDAKISIESVDSADKKVLAKSLNKNDIYIFAKDEVHHSSIIIILDKEWFGLLSSIMMGVEEKENNEITRDLLKKFATELSVTMKKAMRRNDMRLAIGDIEVFTLKQLEKRFEHGEYFHAKMQVSGLADDDVRAEMLIGNPDVRLSGSGSESKSSKDSDKKKEKTESSAKSASGDADEKDAAHKPSAREAGKPEAKESGSKAGATPEQRPEEPAPRDGGASEQLFSGMDTENLEKGDAGMDVDEDQFVSGRKVEFDKFDQGGHEVSNGHSRSMALLKDVEMEVSVQLGQIEMPLGQVLQLAKGSIIELDKLAGEPVDILVNGSKIAQGEVVVIDEHFGVRITNLITTRERIARLK